ncbi:hypothetical protein MKX07_004201 [Trichoderma sp. CBMAI-0711]|uniref:Ser/Thr protein phosphatase, putative n=1 Tax=Trichoderma parareesei TaxID=858221 RepID=A0A2H2Z982_TRIPA|nr:hypothetical protein MKX07_004201 [Trichoderma sp. CBMAI-0711]OTA04407.1 ser/Thr protein phosphatase, putative [Trichoderma parareesei]
MAHQPHRRGIVAAALFFLIASIYLCVTRLYMTGSGTSSTQQLHPNPPPKDIHVQLTDADLPMTYGTFSRPNMDGLTLLATLPESLVPTPSNKRRLVIVGDIHGMDAALEALLRKVDFDPSHDHLIATGDMINKGPDSPGVVSRLMRLNASAVRGNHEDRVLLALAEAEAQTGVSKELASPDAEAHRGEAEFLATGRGLAREHVEWLRKLPVILAVEPLRILVAHAGLVPGVRPELQDPWAVMNMRTLVYPREEMRKKEEGGKKKKKSKAKRDADEASPEAAASSSSPPPPSSDQSSSSAPKEEEIEEEEGETLDSIQQKDAYTDRQVAIPVESRDGEKWTSAWNRFQKRLKKSHRYTVVYGHDSKRGLREERYTFGLDSGCVKGNALTALVVQAKEGGKGEWTHTVMQVQCKDAA